MIKCYFCQTEYNNSTYGLFQLPKLIECRNHQPSCSFTDDNSLFMEYKKFVIELDFLNNTLDVVDLKINPDDSINLISCTIPDTKDINEFTKFLDRIYKLIVFS